ncbi:MAG: hypothetical protein GY705_12910 [Bacteroidetes bacterium]|nr:hypothetical protein [Bacteroidota bacterium]
MSGERKFQPNNKRVMSLAPEYGFYHAPIFVHYFIIQGIDFKYQKILPVSESVIIDIAIVDCPVCSCLDPCISMLEII